MDWQCPCTNRLGIEVEKGHSCSFKNSSPPAQEDVLKIIRCNCKQNCECERCNCKRHGITCYICCGECRGIS